MAIDEKRRPFLPQIWGDPKYKLKNPNESNDDNLDLKKGREDWFAENTPDYTTADNQRYDDLLANQKIVQQWFRGCHSDIGGGNYPHGLSNITLEWMLNAAKNLGLNYNQTYLDIQAAPNAECEIHESKTGVYKLSRSVHREIDKDRTLPETLHSSVISLLKTDGNTYWPQEVKNYIERNPEVLE